MSTADNNNSIDQEDIDVDLLENIVTYFRHWKLFILSIIFFLFLGYIYNKLVTPLYRIESDLLIKDNKQGVSSQNDMLKDIGLFSSEKIIDNEIPILKSNTILEKVIKSLKLQTSYITTEGVRNKEIYDNLPFEAELLKPSSNAYNISLPIQLVSNHEAVINGKKVSIDSPVLTEAGLIIIKPNQSAINPYNKILLINFSEMVDLLQRYKKSLTIEPDSKQSSVLIITLEDAIPQRGKDFLNKLVEEYNLASIEDKNQITSNTLFFIDKELKRIADQLGSVEKNVEQYKSSNRITDISAESQIFLQSVQDYDVQLTRVMIQLNVINNLENYLQNHQDQSAKLPSMLGIEDPTILGLVSKLSETELRRQNLMQTVPETNPLVITLTDQINTLKQSILSSIQNLKNGLQITKQQLQAKNNLFESTIQGVPTKERGLLDVMRKQEIQNNLFTYLLQKREETAMSLASVVSDSRTIDLASSSKYPIKPVKSVVYMVFFLIGLILPAGIIFLSTLLNFKITRRSDIEQATKVPILAEISHSEDSGVIIVSSKPRSMIAEQIRTLRTNMQFVLPDETQKVILFTSSISGEGKSFVSLNLGASLAMTGKKVIILELDLRKPKLHSGLSIDNSIGLSNFLVGKVDYKEIIKEIPFQKDYYIIPSGPIPPNPAELLANGQIDGLIENLKKKFDYIVLDAPPIGLVTDAQILGEYADLTLFIVRHNYTAKAHIKALENLYKNKKFKNINLILNSVDLKMGYGSSYGYGYGYGYGYYQEPTPRKFMDLFNWFKERK
ncbi:MAG: wzc 1 [Mucilaginibacter sp.]|nr:wzc 1 [Mucilaginibacter sp.]